MGCEAIVWEPIEEVIDENLLDKMTPMSRPMWKKDSSRIPLERLIEGPRSVVLLDLQ
jgi:hypothetical protein